MNIFQLFVVRGITLLKSRGIFCQIYPLAFTGDVSLYKLRKEIIEKYDLIGIEAFPERDNPNKRVFENVKMSVCITLLRKSHIQKGFFLRINDDRYVDTHLAKSQFSSEEIKKIDQSYFTIPLLHSSEKNLVSKIYENSVTVSDCGNCYTGELDLTLCKNFLTNNPDDLSMLKGAMIDRYQIKTKMSQGEIQYVRNDFLNHISCNKLEHYNHPRIVMQGITGVNERTRLKMTLAFPHVFCGNSVNYLIADRKLDIYAVLAVMNSKLLNYLFKKFSTNSNVNGYEVNNLPLPRTLHQNQTDFVKLSKKLLEFNEKKAGNENSIRAVEAKIDQLVYQLYSLTPEEIAMVEEAVS